MWISKRCAFFVTLVLAFACAALAAAATPIGTYDQGNAISPGFGGAVHSNLTRAQTFTAGVTGRLTQVDVAVYRYFDDSQPLTVTIETVVDGTPSGNSLGTTVLPAAQVPVSDFPDGEFVSVPLSHPVDVTSGAQYAIVLRSSIAFSYLWISGMPYTSGMPFQMVMENPVWLPEPNVADYAFRTFVTISAQSAGEQLDALAASVDGVGAGQSLTAKVKQAKAALARGETAASRNILNAFVREVTAQTGEKLPASTATDLLTATNTIIAVLGA